MKSVLLVVLISLVAASAFSQTNTNTKYRRRLILTPGLDLSTMASVDRNNTRVQFPNGKNFRAGVGIEFPLGRGKWNILFEPSYNHYTAERPYYLKYRSLELPIGIRRYAGLNGSKKLFINGLYVGDIPLSFKMELAPGIFFPSTNYRSNFAVGGGISFGKLSVEYRYHTKRTRKDDLDSFTFTYQKQAVIVGFRIL
jgi:hypothetical protein